MRELLGKFDGARVLILGDVMLDQYLWGEVDRISPEAPVPVVALNRKTVVAGGAANVAVNVAGLGADPILLGVIGDDPESGELRESLAKSKVSGSYVISTKLRPTTIKTRIIASNQQVVRVDREDVHELETELESAVLKSFKELVEDVDVILISDYAKGTVTAKLIGEAVAAAKKLDKKILIDPKGKDYSKYRKASVLTPNQKEALDAANMEFADDSTIEEAGKYLMSRFELENLVVTRGEKGMTLFGRESPPATLDTVARRVFDVTGAGDTVIATLAVALGTGIDFLSACKLANAAAGVVVERVGTAAITLRKLEEAIP